MEKKELLSCLRCGRQAVISKGLCWKCYEEKGEN